MNGVRYQIMFFIFIALLINTLGFISPGLNNIGKDQKVHTITINADEYTLPLILKALNNTDINISGYIRSVNVVPSELVNSLCPQYNGFMESLGCANRSFISNQLVYADIYISNLDEFKDYYSFNFSLYHEIGHVDHSRKVGFQDDGSQSSIIRGQYANEYAPRYALECNIEIYEDIVNKIRETEATQ